ncbi:C2 and GRAM domain-containing protein At1g03370-like [Impatiens glandulifera]|uniref:C2 and GRAM domain-containing protein At1g03370-like n=1 Tax=Impatiens glandulifera TaxID=253017 RepID=UPI001FB0D3B6|nr:C2 and GRAM domain-containing protein At1g03370-like [Impatiens glandulifera]
MKLFVRVIEARNIPGMDQNGLSDPYVKLQLGKQRFKTKVIKKSLNPSWSQEFCFKVEDLKDELIISVLDEDKFFNDDCIGQIKFPVSQVFDSIDKSLGTAWHPLHPKNKKLKNKDCGEIHLTINFLQSNCSLVDSQLEDEQLSTPQKFTESVSDCSVRSSNGSFRSTSPMKLDDSVSSKEDKSHSQTFAGKIAQIFSRSTDKDLASSSTGKTDLPDIQEDAVGDNEVVSDEQPNQSFDELMKTLESKDQETETPNNLPGGVVLDQLYSISSPELNSKVFSPDSTILTSLADLQGNTDLQIGSWKFESGGDSLKRVVTYTKAANRLIKATRANEEHTYVKVDGKTFAVLASVSTPDVPYGGNFKTELLYLITQGPELPSGEPCSQMVISWRVNFLQSTMMKGMIEGGAKQGIKESFDHYANILAQNVKPVEMKDVASNKEQVLASLQTEQESDWTLAVKFFSNFTVLSAIVLGVYVMVHIWLAAPSTIQGLEFVGLDLPDSIGELIVGGLMALQGARLLEFTSRFLQARAQKGSSDHGVKARGHGWLLTIALVEALNLAAVDSSGFCDPYVVFTCNGKSRTSSIKFQSADPQWNEIFEFDAMDDPPSKLDIEIFDFDGPFSEAESLGHAEINFVKSNISDLADVWLPLQGKLAQACQSKLHLRIFLDNTKGNNVVSDYLTKVEKEVGKKIKQRSPQTNSAFQKLFGLTAQEFLINDFTCHLKRRMPLQGRLFLSARIIGFHADLFGHKTKFFFLWEDIEDIQVVPPTLSSMGSPVVVITLKPGRGEDAKHGAKTQDAEGRLKFNFQTFVSFNVAYRTVMALWKARALTPEQKVQIVEEESEAKNSQTAEEENDAKMLQQEDSGSFSGIEDPVNQTLVYSSVIAVPTSFFMELFIGSELERKVMEKAGCVSYSQSPWEFDESDICQRHIYYKFDKSISRYSGDVTSTQQRSHLPENNNGWLIEEVMTLHGVPLGDYFSIQLKYQIEEIPSRSNGCNVQVFFGIAWLKSSRHQKRITKNILSSMQDRLKIIFSTVEKEFVSEQGVANA